MKDNVPYHALLWCVRLVPLPCIGTSPCQCQTPIMLTPATPRHDPTVTSAGAGLPHALKTSPAAKAARSHVQNWYTQTALPARVINNAESRLSGRNPGNRLGSHPCNLMASTPSKGRSRPTSQKMPEGTNVGKSGVGPAFSHRNDVFTGMTVGFWWAMWCRQAANNKKRSRDRVGKLCNQGFAANLDATCWRDLSPCLLVLLVPDVVPLQDPERAPPGTGLPHPISHHEQWATIAQEERIRWHRAGAAANTLGDVVGAPLSSCFVKAMRACHVGSRPLNGQARAPCRKLCRQTRNQHPNIARLPPRRHSWSGPYAGPCLAERQHSLKIPCGTYAQTSQRGTSVHGKSHRWCEWPPPPR